MNKFIIGLFACVVAVVVLAGCEKKQEAPTPPEQPSTNAPVVP
jgi:outer membrane murein-binding lipoprotein Lpp